MSFEPGMEERRSNGWRHRGNDELTCVRSDESGSNLIELTPLLIPELFPYIWAADTHSYIIPDLTGFVLDLSLRILSCSQHSAQWLDLSAWCVRLSRLLVCFRTHFESLHFHSFIHFVAGGIDRAWSTSVR